MDYLGNARIVIFTDSEKFVLMDFDTSLKRSSKFFTKQFDSTKPTWFDGTYRYNIIEDETEYLQWGLQEEHNFWEYQMSDNIPSYWIEWPTEEKPSNKYKYLSGYLSVSPDIMNWTR